MKLVGRSVCVPNEGTGKITNISPTREMFSAFKLLGKFEQFVSVSVLE